MTVYCEQLEGNSFLIPSAVSVEMTAARIVPSLEMQHLLFIADTNQSPLLPFMISASI
jgi:hypothetical protein